MLSDPFSRRAIRGRADLAGRRSAEVLRGEWRPKTPMAVEYAMGGKMPGDFVWTTSAGLVLLGPRVVGLLMSMEATGWLSFPVSLSDGHSSAVGGFVGLSVVGRCGPIEWSRSEVVIKPAPNPRGTSARYQRGPALSPDLWDGSDIFCSSDGSNFVFVTGRVNEAIGRSGLSNFETIPLASLERKLVTEA